MENFAVFQELYVAITSDRGLCGGVHSSICKTIRNELLEKPSLDNVGIICVGDKSRAQIARYSTFYVAELDRLHDVLSSFQLRNNN